MRSHLAVQHGRQRLHLVDRVEVLERSRREEERVSLLERHRTAELGLVVVVAQVRDLVEVAAQQSS